MSLWKVNDRKEKWKKNHKQHNDGKSRLEKTMNYIFKRKSSTTSIYNLTPNNREMAMIDLK